MQQLATIVLGLIILVGVILLVGALLAFPIMLLWNALLPEIFGWKVIGFWQAWGLLILCGLLFKPAGYSGSSNKSD